MVVIENLDKNVIDAGKRIINSFKKSAGIKIHIAYWMHDISMNAYQLIICTSGTRTRGPLELYKLLERVLNGTIDDTVKLNIYFVSERDSKSQALISFKDYVKMTDSTGVMIRPPRELETDKPVYIYR